MELQPRLSEEQSHAPPEYNSLQGTNKNPGFYNVEFNQGNKRNELEEIYDEIGNAQCWVVSFHFATLYHLSRGVLVCSTISRFFEPQITWVKPRLLLKERSSYCLEMTYSRGAVTEFIVNIARISWVEGL